MKHVAAMVHRLPPGLLGLVAAYFVASLAHFVHNAEYIAYYPGMPPALTREKVYLAWLAVTGVGALGLGCMRMRFYALGAALVAGYGALGLSGLAHYTLALCAEHTLVSNITIWSEAVTGVAVLLSFALFASRAAARGTAPRQGH